MPSLYVMKKFDEAGNVDDSRLSQTFAYAFIGFILLLILVFASIGYSRQENGIAIHANTCPNNSPNAISITIEIDENNIVTIDHEQVSELNIPIRIKERLATLPSDKTLAVIIRPNEKCKFDSFARIIDLINEEDNSRIQVDIR